MKEVFIDSGSYLSDVFDDLPNNVYLDKTSCGCGATTLALTNSVRYVILVPSLCLVNNKTQQLSNVFGFHGDVKSSELLSYVENGGKKIIGTYDSLNRILSVLGMIGSLRSWKLLVDEAHNLINLAELKGGVLNCILDNYKSFGNWVFVTATPTNKEFLPKQLEDVDMVKYVWKDSQTIALCVQQTTDVLKSFTALCKQHIEGRLFGNAHIFINSVSMICGIVNKLRRAGISNTNNTKIVCADNLDNRAFLKKQLGVEWQTPSQPNCGGKVVFYTSVAFEGSDVYDEDGITYIGVDCSKNNTKLDMSLSVAQIVGRVRNSKYRGELKMLVSGMPLAATTSKEEYDAVHETMLKEAVGAVALYNSTTNKIVRKALLENINNADGYLVIDDCGDLIVNDLMIKLQKQKYLALHSTYVVHKLSTGVKEYYKLSDKIINSQDVFVVPSFEDELVTNERMIWEDLCKAYIKAREENDDEKAKLIEVYEPILSSIYNVLGVQRMKTLRYGKKALSCELENLCPDATVFLDWKIGEFISLVKAKRQIQEYFNLRGDRRKAKAVDAYQWYFLTETKRRVNGSSVYGYVVNGLVR